MKKLSVHNSFKPLKTPLLMENIGLYTLAHAIHNVRDQSNIPTQIQITPFSTLDLSEDHRKLLYEQRLEAMKNYVAENFEDVDSTLDTVGIIAEEMRSLNKELAGKRLHYFTLEQMWDEEKQFMLRSSLKNVQYGLAGPNRHVVEKQHSNARMLKGAWSLGIGENIYMTRHQWYIHATAVGVCSMSQIINSFFLYHGLTTNQHQISSLAGLLVVGAGYISASSIKIVAKNTRKNPFLAIADEIDERRKYIQETINLIS